MTRRLRLGLIVNPIAGLGGRVGLKGTDGVADEAVRRGAVASSGERAMRAIKRLAAGRADVAIIAGHGTMGQRAASDAGYLVQLVSAPLRNQTSAEDTKQAAREMHAAAVDLILFAGGDGTARDIFETTGDAVPLVGVPAGVKMQSAVFATSPEAAGDVIVSLVEGKVSYRLAEIMDIDEAELRNGVISPRLYGYAKVPDVPLRLQNAKARQRALDEATVDEAAQTLAGEFDPNVLYAIGPGRTAKKILEALGLQGTLLGTDLVHAGKLVMRDANERNILEHAQGLPLKIMVGVIGGQGYVFGRGNHELSPQVIRRAGRSNITIIAAQQKLMALADKRLLVDTGDVALDLELAGYWRVVVGPVDQMVMKMAAA